MQSPTSTFWAWCACIAGKHTPRIYIGAGYGGYSTCPPPAPTAIRTTGPASRPWLIHVATMILTRPKVLGQGRGTREPQAEFDFKGTYTLHGRMDGQWQGHASLTDHRERE